MPRHAAQNLPLTAHTVIKFFPSFFPPSLSLFLPSLPILYGLEIKTYIPEYAQMIDTYKMWMNLRGYNKAHRSALFCFVLIFLFIITLSALLLRGILHRDCLYHFKFGICLVRMNIKAYQRVPWQARCRAQITAALSESAKILFINCKMFARNKCSWYFLPRLPPPFQVIASELGVSANGGLFQNMHYE